jgi:hypothetical protein
MDENGSTGLVQSPRDRHYGLSPISARSVCIFSSKRKLPNMCAMAMYRDASPQFTSPCQHAVPIKRADIMILLTYIHFVGGMQIDGFEDSSLCRSWNLALQEIKFAEIAVMQ